MTTVSIHEDRVVETWGGRIKLRVAVAGSGPALVYLHPAGGMKWDPFLMRLAEQYTIYAPLLPGISEDDTFAIHQVDDMFDLVLIYEEGLRALGLNGAPIMGQSFGGMVAAELAACFPSMFSKLVLLDAGGLWSEKHPYTLDYLTGPPEEIPSWLFADPESPAAQAILALPDDPAEALDATVREIWAVGCSVKFTWPFPESGLVKRLHRIEADSLIVWGEQDRMLPVAYADEFGQRIPNSRVEIVPGSGHIPQVEQMETTFGLVSRFLGEAP